MERRGDELRRLPTTHEQGASPSWEQFVRESLVQAAWPVALAPPPRRALTVDQQPRNERPRQNSSSASELITRRGVFSRRQYGSVEQVTTVPGPSNGPDVVIRRYRLENGNSLGERDELFGPHNAPVVENPEFHARWYFKYFLGKMHYNYVGMDVNRDPFMLTIVQEHLAGLIRAILFSKNGSQKIHIPPSSLSDAKSESRARASVKNILGQFPALDRADKATKDAVVVDPLKEVLTRFPNLERMDRLPKEIPNAEVQKDVLLLEEQEGTVSFKIGVMFMKPGQLSDDEMLSNEFGDAQFERFVCLLGDKIRLKGWNRFRGGLDIKGDMTGHYSVYTMHHGHEIMFHVSTLLPHSKDNKQQLERKRHIGNDIVNIIYVDEKAHDTFNPQFIKSHFTHIFAVVSEVYAGYKLSIYTDDLVPPFGPSLPCPPIFLDPYLFRDYLLVKLMNGEKAAFHSPVFTQKRQRTMDTLIRDIYTEHCVEQPKVPMLSRRALSDVWSGNSSSAGAARLERFISMGQAIKLDAVLRGDAPTNLISSGQKHGNKAPWEGTLWRSTPLPGAPVCAEQISEGKLLLSTNGNTYLLEESGTTRVVLRWEGCVRSARLTERAGLFRVGARPHGTSSHNVGTSGMYTIPLHELYSGSWAGRPLSDCKQARLSRTKTAHYFDLVDHDGRITIAVAVGRRVLIMAEKPRDNSRGFDYVHIKDILLGEVPSLVKYMDYDSGVIVAAYKHHWDIIDCANGQCFKRADGSEQRRGTLVNAIRIGDDRDCQLILCYNHTCHFERLTEHGLESDEEYDFHWTTVPQNVVNAFPYMMAFAEDLLEIRLTANGSLVHAACIPGLKLLCGRRVRGLKFSQDTFYVACSPDYVPATDDMETDLGLPPESMEKIRIRQQPYQTYPHITTMAPSNIEDDQPCGTAMGGIARIIDGPSASTSSCSSSVSSSEHESIRPPLVRMAPVSPPNSPHVMASTSSASTSVDHGASTSFTPLTSTTSVTTAPSSSRCVRVFVIPHGNLNNNDTRESDSTDQPEEDEAPASRAAIQLEQALREQQKQGNDPINDPQPSTSKN